MTFSKCFIGGHKSKNFEMLPHDLPLHTGFSGCIFDIELRTKDTVFPVTSSSPATGRGVGECHRNECIRHSMNHIIYFLVVYARRIGRVRIVLVDILS